MDWDWGLSNHRIDRAVDSRIWSGAQLQNSDRSLWESNLACIQEMYPGLAVLLCSLPSAGHPASSLEEDKTTFDPNRELNKEWRPNAGLHIVDRFASTRLARILFDRINLADLKEDRNRRLLLLEDRPQILRDALERDDWRSLIHSERCLFAVDVPERNAFMKLLRTYPQLSHTSFQIYAGDHSSTQERRASIRQALTQYQNALTRSIREFIHSRHGKQTPPFPNTIRLLLRRA